MDTNAVETTSGGCLCGAVRFRIAGALRAVLVCHCGMCQRQHTHAGAYTACDPADLEMLADAELRWYRSSPIAQRGFCGRCGSGLFWKADEAAHLSVAAGAIDDPARLRPGGHIHVEERSALYGLPGRQT